MQEEENNQETLSAVKDEPTPVNETKEEPGIIVTGAINYTLKLESNGNLSFKYEDTDVLKLFSFHQARNYFENIQNSPDFKKRVKYQQRLTLAGAKKMCAEIADFFGKKVFNDKTMELMKKQMIVEPQQPVNEQESEKRPSTEDGVSV